MGLERNSIETYRAKPDKFLAAAGTLAVTDQRVLVDATAGAVTVTLPPVALARGKSYSIRKTDAVANAVTVAGAGDEAVAFSNATLDAQNDRIVVWSDGIQWYEIAAVIAA